MAFARGEVRRHNGVPTIFADGEPLHGMTATSCVFNDPQVVRDFVAGGCEIMMIWIEAGIKCWKGPGEYDWTYAEEKLKFFEEHSGDSKWVIRVRLGLLNSWFKVSYPSEVHNPETTGDGPGMAACNLTSHIWRENVELFLRDFVAWLQTTRWASRIIGFMLNAGSTEEWLIFDVADNYNEKYHPVYVREFRSWLERKYQTPAALQAAWENESVTFQTAYPPTGHALKGSHIWGPYSLRHPKHERQAIDYYHFLNETLADALIGFCKAAKQAADSPIICGGFHSYLWWETGVYSYIQQYGHGYVQRLNDSPWVDFVSDITSYDDRYPGGPSGYLGLPHCQNLHNTLHYTEVDLTTLSSLPQKHREAWKQIDPATIPVFTAEPAIPDQIWKWDMNYCGRDEDEQVGILQREHLHNLITGTPYWWFDIRCHNYQEPPFVKAMKQLSDIGKRAVNWDRSTACDVAFVVSEDTPMYQATMNGHLMRFELESLHTLLADVANRRWGVAGVPFDIYELHDLAHPEFPGDQYKLIVFINCAFVSEKAAAGIRRWQRDGRTLLWTFAPAVMNDEQLDPALGEELIGMRLGWRNQRQHIHVMVDGPEHPLTQGGRSLDFGTEGSAGPVFFVDDPQATVLGHLSHGGEPAFAVRDHGDWKSVYLSMINFGPALFRNLARFAGAHVWNESDDVIYANRSLLCLHTASPGLKRIELPAPAYVTDLFTGERTAAPIRVIETEMPPYRTRGWRTEYVTE